jgi:hypothetical protein
VKLEQGDAFECNNAEWIRQNLPHYEQVWSAFIGHNGRGWPCPMPGLDIKAETDRKKFYQAHYSIACKMHAICASCHRNDKTLGHVTDQTSFDAEMNHLYILMAHIGNVRDMFKVIDEALSANGALLNPLQTFFAQRSHVLHGPRLPVRMSDGFIMIPRIGGINKLPGEWDDKSTWDSIPEGDFVFLRDYAAELTREHSILVTDVHGKVFDAANKRFGGKRIIESMGNLASLPFPTSGVTYFYSYPQSSQSKKGDG